MKFVTRPSSWVAFDETADTKLTYALQVNPAPLTVSHPDKNPVYGSLQFVITNATGSAKEIMMVEFIFPVGGDGSDLTPSTAGIQTDVSDSVNWTVRGPSTPITKKGTATYRLAPTADAFGSLAAGASLVVEIFEMKTGLLPGNSMIEVKEMAGSPVTPAFARFQVTTFPTGFFFNGLSASTRSGSSLVPVAQVDTGSTVTLTWNSSVLETDSFTIYYSDAKNGQQTAKPADIGTWVSPPLTSDTVFTVMVTASVDGGQPMTAGLTTAVSVHNPSLVAANIEVGPATVAGALTARGGATITSGLTADHATVTGALTAKGGATITSDLAVKGSISGIGMVPPGGIIMHHGDTKGNFDKTGLGIDGTPYEGWAICNSKNKTPDLRGRFILGCNDANPPTTKGGEENVTLTVEQIPSHTHGYSYTNPIGQKNDTYYSGSYWGPSTDVLQTNPAGDGKSHNNMPPYYALYFIMRLH